MELYLFFLHFSIVLTGGPRKRSLPINMTDIDNEEITPNKYDRY